MEKIEENITYNNQKIKEIEMKLIRAQGPEKNKYNKILSNLKQEKLQLEDQLLQLEDPQEAAAVAKQEAAAVAEQEALEAAAAVEEETKELISQALRLQAAEIEGTVADLRGDINIRYDVTFAENYPTQDQQKQQNQLRRKPSIYPPDKKPGLQLGDIHSALDRIQQYIKKDNSGNVNVDIINPLLSFNTKSRNQLKTQHCFGVSMCDVLVSFLVQKCLLTARQAELLFTFYLNRVNLNTYVSSAVNMNLLALFIYELNNGFGTFVEIDANTIYVYNFPPGYDNGIKFGDVRITKGQFQFKKIPFKPFLVTKEVFILLSEICMCLLERCEGIDFEEFIPDIVAPTTDDAILIEEFIDKFINFVQDRKTIISVQFNDKVFEKIETPDTRGFINLPEPKKKDIFDASHAMVCYGLGPVITKKTDNSQYNTIDLINSWGLDWGVDATSRNNMPLKVGHLVINPTTVRNYIQTVIRLKCANEPLSVAGQSAVEAVRSRTRGAIDVDIIVSPDNIERFYNLTHPNPRGGSKAILKYKPKKSKTKRRRKGKKGRKTIRRRNSRTKR